MAVTLFIATVTNKETGKEATLKDSASGPYIIMTTESDARVVGVKYAECIGMVIQRSRGEISQYSAVFDAKFKESVADGLYEIKIESSEPFLIQ